MHKLKVWNTCMFCRNKFLRKTSRGSKSIVFSARKCMSSINGSGASGSGSAENLSSGSNNQTSSASRGDAFNPTSNSNTITPTESFKLPTLTESLLNRHNEDMEKLMMQKHRKLRSSIKNSDKLKDSRIKTDQSVNQGHGVKRSGSHSWEGDSFKVSFHLSRVTHRYLQFLVLQC